MESYDLRRDSSRFKLGIHTIVAKINDGNYLRTKAATGSNKV